jgi:small-conductance mechanosensitive channel
MNTQWLLDPRFQIFHHGVSIGGAVAFIIALAAGFLLSAIIQSDRVRNALCRIGLGKNFANIVTTTMSLLALVSFAIFGLNLLGFPINWEAPIPGIGHSVGEVVRLVVMLLAVFWLSSASKRFLFNRYITRMGSDRALQYAITQIVGYVVLITGIFIVLQNTGINLSTLTVFAGAVGVGVGFGLQNITSNFISGLVILAERPVKIGDRVEVEGVSGLVKEIRARSTTILTNDNIAFIVPNSQFIEKTVTNWTHGDPKIRFRIPVSVAYGSDVEKIRDILVSIARAHPSALQKPEPVVFFEGFGDSALNFELVVWSEEMSYRPRRFKSDLNFAIEKKFREADIVIPFPQRDVHIIGNSGKVDT